MKLAVLQLSDIHFAANRNYASKRVQQLIAAVTAADLFWDEILVVSSGDISQAGQVSEFDQGERFLASVLSGLMARRSIPTPKLAVIPGNHDCDLTRSDAGTRDIVLDAFRKDTGTLDVLAEPMRHVLNAQENYFAFQASSTQRTSSGINQFCDVLCLKYGNHHIQLLLLNSAFATQHGDNRGKLLFPSSALPTFHSTSSQSTYSIAAIHHPLDWFEQNSQNAVRHFLEKNADMILLGHEHDQDARKIETQRSETYLEIRAEALQEPTSGSSGFNVILIDLETLDHEIIPFRWANSYYKAAERTHWTKSRESLARKRLFQPNLAHLERLDNAGAGGVFTDQTNVSLDAIYVYPDLRNISNSQEHKEELASASLLSDVKAAGNASVVYGDAQSGKTLLLHKTCKSLIGNSKIPVIVEGNDLGRVHTMVNFC